MDPISIIVTALATGAVAGLKPTAEQVVKDAYAGLKRLIKDKYERVSVELLENDPADKARQQILKGDLEKTDAAADAEVLRQARAVLDVVRKQAPEAAAAVGVKFDDLEAASLKLDDIIASGTGVDIRKGKFTGAVEISKARAGQPPEPPGSTDRPQRRQRRSRQLLPGSKWRPSRSRMSRFNQSVSRRPSTSTSRRL